MREGLDLWQRFEVERYLDYHGDKLVRRFDTNSYLIIGKAMDLHDVGRNRGGLEAAMRRVGSPTLSIEIARMYCSLATFAHPRIHIPPPRPWQARTS